MAFVGTELKFQLDIEAEGFSMADDDFKVIISNYNKRKEIKKEDMKLDDNENYLFTVDTAYFGSGEYLITIIAYVPDEDFDDGIRTEVQKQVLCQVKS